MEEDGLRPGSGGQASTKGRPSQSLNAMLDLLAGLGGSGSNGRAGPTSIRRRATEDANLQVGRMRPWSVMNSSLKFTSFLLQFPPPRALGSHLAAVDRASSGPSASEHAVGWAYG